VTRWYDLAPKQVPAAIPNPAHQALACWSDSATKNDRAIHLVTQNVDRLHHAAGSTRILELHGSCWDMAMRALRAGTRGRKVPFAEYPATL